MTEARVLTLALFSSIAILTTSTIANAADPQFCDGYAAQAAHEAELVERFKCAFRDQRSAMDIEVHWAWCHGSATTMGADRERHAGQGP
jgi:hypothetical protein